MTPGALPRRVAVVGSGVAGLTAAHVIAREAEVTLYEADSRAGGHAHTHELELADGQRVAVDTGFIVHNTRTYPTLCRLFAELGVLTQPSDMSMSILNPATGAEYAGGKGLFGLFPNWQMLASRQHVHMLIEVRRFHQAAKSVLHAPDNTLTVGDFLVQHRLSDYFRSHFMTPLIAAVWSCDPACAPEYPAKYLFKFLEHHGMLSVTGSPSWRTVSGGSIRYVNRILDTVQHVRTASAVRGISRYPDYVRVHDQWGGSADFDAVVLATHPQQALAVLDTPTRLERLILGGLRYTPNRAVLHTSQQLLPRAARARASWNYRISADGPITVTYDLTRLMRLPKPSGQRVLVTLGGANLIDPDRVLATMNYEHPCYTIDFIAAQRRLPELDTPRLAFAGAYHGWGFHEDGALSGVRAAARLGFAWDGARQAVTV